MRQTYLQKLMSLAAIASILVTNVGTPSTFAAPIRPKVPVKAKAISTPASLTIKAGIVLESKDVKYLAKTAFALVSQSFHDVWRLTYMAEMPDLETYLREKGASQQFIDWTKNVPGARFIAEDGFDIQALGPRLDEIVNVIKVGADVPEFQEFFKMQKQREDCQIDSSPAFCSSDKTFAGLHLYKTLPEYLRVETYFRHVALRKKLAFKVVEEYIATKVVQTCITDFTGSCVFSGITPGKYYVIPLERIKQGKDALFWNVEVNLKPGSKAYLEMSNDNLDKALSDSL